MGRQSTPLPLALLWLLASGSARGDGAFPDSLGILLPLDQPNRIIAKTNFGLLVSEDAGASWEWVCEQAIGLNTFIYQIGPPPSDRLYAVSFDGLTFSTDFGCTWDRVQGQLATFNVTDAFPDPSDSTHVLAVARPGSVDGGTPPQGVYESTDGGRTFGPPLYVAPDAQRFVSGVEIAQSNPNRYFVTMYSISPSTQPYIVRSIDRGASWEVLDLSPSVGGKAVQLLGVDPADAQTLYLRLSDNFGREQLAISNDAGLTARIALQLPFRMTAFLRRASGTLMVAGSDGGVFISTDRGSSFTRSGNTPHFRGLGERSGRLYAVTDNLADGYAVAVSMNDGASWQPLLRFDQLRGPKACGSLLATCAAPWEALKVTLGIGNAADGGTAPPRRSGCGCSSDRSSETLVAGGCLLIAMLRSRRTARRRINA